MARKLKLVTGLSTIALSGALALGGCGAEGEGQGDGSESAQDPSLLVEGEGESFSGGEAEGESEGEGAVRSGDPATDDAAYLHQLGMVRGHLAAFIELYRAGAYEMAARHVKHPESELYVDLAPAIAARRAAGFANELEALAAAAEQQSGVEEQYAATLAAIRANAPAADVQSTLLGVSQLVKSAADEFDIGVGDDGAVEQPHEYQDAYGFLSTAREMLSELDTADINAGEAIAISHEQIDLSLASFDGLIANTTEGVSSTIYGAASRIEIAALAL